MQLGFKRIPRNTVFPWNLARFWGRHLQRLTRMCIHSFNNKPICMYACAYVNCCQPLTMWRNFEGGVYCDELVDGCSNISRAAGFQGVATFQENTVSAYFLVLVLGNRRSSHIDNPDPYWVSIIQKLLSCFWLPFVESYNFNLRLHVHANWFHLWRPLPTCTHACDQFRTDI